MASQRLKTLATPRRGPANSSANRHVFEYHTLNAGSYRQLMHKQYRWFLFDKFGNHDYRFRLHFGVRPGQVHWPSFGSHHEKLSNLML